MVWASCLQEVQALRQGGSWQRGKSGTTVAAAGAAALGGDRSDGSVVGRGAKDQQQHADDKLNEQLDVLATLTYPNSSIRYMFMVRVPFLLVLRTSRCQAVVCGKLATVSRSLEGWRADLARKDAHMGA